MENMNEQGHKHIKWINSLPQSKRIAYESLRNELHQEFENADIRDDEGLEKYRKDSKLWFLALRRKGYFDEYELRDIEPIFIEWIRENLEMDALVKDGDFGLRDGNISVGYTESIGAVCDKFIKYFESILSQISDRDKSNKPEQDKGVDASDGVDKNNITDNENLELKWSEKRGDGLDLRELVYSLYLSEQIRDSNSRAASLKEISAALGRMFNVKLDDVSDRISKAAGTYKKHTDGETFPSLLNELLMRHYKSRSISKPNQ